MVDDKLLKKLRAILKSENPNTEISDEQLRAMGLSVIRFVLLKELAQ